MCKTKKIEKIADKTWVEVTGTIKKGTYHSEIPIIEVTQIEEIEKPENDLVYPPDEYYIPTSVLF